MNVGLPSPPLTPPGWTPLGHEFCLCLGLVLVLIDKEFTSLIHCLKKTQKQTKVLRKPGNHVFSICCLCQYLEFQCQLFGTSIYEPYNPCIHPLMIITLDHSMHGLPSKETVH